MNQSVSYGIALLLAAATAFGVPKAMSDKCCPDECQIPPAYNFPAGIEVSCGWDVYGSASFIYWDLIQENMEICFTDEISPSLANFQGEFEGMDFDYQPGFKVGLGTDLNYDDWDLYAEYTRIRSDNSGSATAPATGGIYPTWGHPYIAGSNAFNTAFEHWHCNLDFVDLELGRSYYVGTALIFHPILAVRGAWIRQMAHVNYVNNNIVSATPSPSILGEENVYQRTHSWAVGPRVGIDCDWMLTKEFRLFGEAYGDLLYTKYKTQSKTVFLPYVTNTTTTPNYFIGVPVFFISRTDRDEVRAHVDLETGFGWGTYLDSNKWHIDFEASYGFQVFFDQQMFRHYEDHTAVAQVKSPNGNLYIHGLTVTGRVDF
ncbi:MAG TPA: Lpg1974 family pore-forming outer membrane protein [Chlamydiales bacterium]|nr:Lpg1974 family pore-forming outer membrane protein [Chlamydiales bacterium]